MDRPRIGPAGAVLTLMACDRSRTPADDPVTVAAATSADRDPLAQPGTIIGLGDPEE